MAGCKRKLSELDGFDEDVDSSSKQSRLPPSATPIVSEHPGLATSRSGLQDDSIMTHHAGTQRSYLDVLPAEILLNIFPRCRNPCLSHVSSRLRQILPAFREISKSLAGFAMAALPYSGGNGQPAKLDHLPIWRVVRELYASRWIGPPETLTERLTLQEEVFNSCWFKEYHFMETHFLTFYKLLDLVFNVDGCFRYRLASTRVTSRGCFDLSKGQAAKVRRLIKAEILHLIKGGASPSVPRKS